MIGVNADENCKEMAFDWNMTEQFVLSRIFAIPREIGQNVKFKANKIADEVLAQIDEMRYNTEMNEAGI